MKNVIAGILVAFVMMIGLVVTLSENGMHANLHSRDITATTHTYKLYDSFFDSFLGLDPIMSCSLDIQPNGNYAGNPTTEEFRLWLNSCRFDTKRFTPQRMAQAFR